ncbi:DUF1697 domain-containing protein [Butyricicoccus sp. 1XD8-22]|nr:DUF1697 domain-containing protein [Butyricicoccus sp. 1XD8-22]
MKRYIALLRGINISGKNKIPMAELRRGVEGLGFGEVKTFLNSGNVIFSSELDQETALSGQIEAMIKSQFDLEIPVLVVTKEVLENLLRSAPGWWGSEGKEVYDNLIFVLPPAAADDVFRELGEPKEGLEKAMRCGDAIFWSFSRKSYQKTNWWSKTASAGIAKKLTIRTANTVQKLVGM